MSFNFKLKNTNVSCAPMYNSQNPNQIYGYLCNPQQRRFEGFQNASPSPVKDGVYIDTPQITLITNNGYNATGQFLSRYSPDFTQIFFDSRTPISGANGSAQQGQVTSPLPVIGSTVEGPFVQPGTRVVNVQKTDTMPGNPYVAGYTVTLNQPLANVNETLGAFLAYRLSAPVAPAPSATAVTLYQNCDKSGWARNLPGVGTFKADVDYPADASYIMVPAGFRATIYTGVLSGQSKVIDENQAYIFCNDGSWANDSIKSIVVTSSTAPVPVPAPRPVPAPISLIAPVVLAPAPGPSNTYDNAVTYNEGDKVSFNGSLYSLTKFIGAAGYAPTYKPQNWANLTNPALNYKDGLPYSNDILYDAGNIVTLDGTAYILKEFIGGAGYVPGSNPNWALLNPRVVPAPAPAPAPSSTAVTLYQNCDRSGWARNLPGVGTFKADVDYPADASYIVVPAGFRATIYTGVLSGQSKVINENQAYIFCNDGSWANDSIKSIVVTSSVAPVPVPAPAPVRVRVPTERFNPSTIGGLQIWLDSADETTVTLSSGNVAAWMDKSGNSNHFSVAPTFIPPSYKNINSGITFTSKQVMISTAPVTTNKNTTVFFVGNVASRNTDFDYILAFAQKDHAFRWNPRNNFGDSNNNDFAPDTGYIVNGQPSRVKYDFTQMALVNFVVANGGSGQLTLSTNKTFGGDRFFKGVIYELLIFNSPLSAAQTQQIQTYLMSKWNLPGIATGYTCPPGMLQRTTDSQNGSCLAPCNSTNGGSNTFNYGPKNGGYPTNRRSGADRCADLNNGTDQSQAFAARTSNWPPLAGGDPSCFVNGKFESAGMKLYTQADCENVIGGNYYPTDHTPGYGECLYPEGGSHSYTCRRQ